MPKTLFFYIGKNWMWILLALLSLANVPVHAESGSTQAIMSLIVPVTASNAMKPNLHRSLAPSQYDSSTNINIMQKMGNKTFRIWSEI